MQTELVDEFRVKRTQGNRILIRARHPRDDFTCWVEDGPVEVRALGDRGIDVQGSIPPEAIPWVTPERCPIEGLVQFEAGGVAM